MRRNALFLLLFNMINVANYAQNNPAITLNINDPAPPLKITSWLKGTPVEGFKKGNIYVVEFWATWCVPCRRAIPHLSDLARKYKNQITFLGIDVLERIAHRPLKRVQAFVDSMGKRMDYDLAADESNFMETRWMKAGAGGLPSTFVVNGEGKIAWIGHPMDDLETVLDKILNKTWDIKTVSAKRKFDQYLRMMDDSLNHELMRYSNMKYVLVQPDSLLAAVDEIVKKEPALKYAPFIASNTFNSLLITGQQEKAYTYGKQVLTTTTYTDPACEMIMWNIETWQDKLKLSPAIYQLGVEACEMYIKMIVPEEFSEYAPRHYSRMAGFYWRAGEKEKAIEAQEKAISVFKSRDQYSSVGLAEYDSQLQQWIGSPQNDTFNVEAAKISRKENIKLALMDDSLRREMLRYTSEQKAWSIGRTDSLLMAVERVLKKEPRLKYAPNMASWIFNSLIETGQQQKAYEYGKLLLAQPIYTDPAYYVIVGSIDYYAGKIKLLPELYKLGVDACKVSIDNISAEYATKYAPGFNQKMADWRKKADTLP